MRSQRLIAAAVVIALSGALAGCSSSISGFDPTDLLDFLDTKKKLPGDRKPVFPEGVPGLEQGVPKDLYKDQVEQQRLQEEQAAQAPVEAQPIAPPPDAKGKKKGKKASKSASNAQPPADGEAAPAEDTTPAAPAAPKKKIVRQ